MGTGGAGHEGWPAMAPAPGSTPSSPWCPGAPQWLVVKGLRARLPQEGVTQDTRGLPPLIHSASFPVWVGLSGRSLPGPLRVARVSTVFHAVHRPPPAGLPPSLEVCQHGQGWPWTPGSAWQTPVLVSCQAALCIVYVPGVSSSWGGSCQPLLEARRISPLDPRMPLPLVAPGQ